MRSCAMSRLLQKLPRDMTCALVNVGSVSVAHSAAASTSAVLCGRVRLEFIWLGEALLGLFLKELG